MPEEVFIIIVVAITAGAVTVTSIARSIARVIQSRSAASSGPGASLTRSELLQLLRQAVEEGTQPLAARIDHLERRLDEAAALEAGRRPPLLPEGERPAGGDVPRERSVH